MSNDRQLYMSALIRSDPGGLQECVRIEKKHHLYGYPPELVSIGLAAADKGEDPVHAVERYVLDQSKAVALGKTDEDLEGL